MAKEEAMKLFGQIEKKARARELLALEIEKDIEVLAAKCKKFAKNDLDIYKALVKPDTLFNDSPISPFWTYHWIKQHMIKSDMDFIGVSLDGKHTIKPFSLMAIEASKWILRFAKEAEVEKKGIEAIL